MTLLRFANGIAARPFRPTSNSVPYNAGSFVMC